MMFKTPCMDTSNFNPRSREGSDTACRPTPGCPIHFNPRSREGNDAKDGGRQESRAEFQSTLP